MESDIKRVVGRNGAAGGKVVGRYFIAEDKRIELHIEKFAREFRHMREFVLKFSPYVSTDIKAMDYLTFFRVVNECEQREREAVERLEKQGHE